MKYKIQENAMENNTDIACSEVQHENENNSMKKTNCRRFEDLKFLMNSLCINQDNCVTSDPLLPNSS